MVQISVTCCPNTYQIMYGAQTSFNGKFRPTEKNCFSDRAFYVTDADIRSLKSLHTLFDKLLDHILVKFEQNHIVENIHNFEFFGKNWSTILEKGLTPF